MNIHRALVCLAFTLSACQQPSPPSDERVMPASTPVENEPLSDASLYDLRVKLIDQSGRSIGLNADIGHPVIVSMFYGSCPYACPTLINDVKRIVATLPIKARRDVRILLVSFDPERDTPAALEHLAERHHLDPVSWRLATTSSEEARDLAATLGINYKKLPNGAFNHSSVITLLDRTGVPRFRQDGLGDPPEVAGRVLASLLKPAEG